MRSVSLGCQVPAEKVVVFQKTPEEEWFLLVLKGIENWTPDSFLQGQCLTFGVEDIEVQLILLSAWFVNL